MIRTPFHMARFVAIFAVALAAVFAPAQASVPNCEALAAGAGARAGLPDGLLPSIARVESGRTVDGKRAAWPWTLNQAGKGMYFETREAALDYLKSAVARGVRNIDVGCMQINYRWHGDQFASLEEMMDPVLNTSYAARFMTELYNRLGSWDRATGEYHSTNPARSAKYRKLVEYALTRIPDTETMLTAYETVTIGTPLVTTRPSGYSHSGQVVGILAHSPGPLVALGSVPVRVVKSDPMAAAAALPDSAPLDYTQPIYEDLRAREHLPGALQRRWDKIEALRADFAASSG